MAEAFRLPDPGEGIHEAEIREILVSPGDSVEEGQQIIVVETDKASFELTSPFAGTIAEVKVAVDDVVNVGAVLLTIEGGKAKPEKAAKPAKSQKRDAKAKEPKEKPAKQKAERGKAEEGPDERPEADAEPEEQEAEAAAEQEDTRSRDEEAHERAPQRPARATPVVRRLAREHGVDLHGVKGSGPDGRVTKEDVRSSAGNGKETRRQPDAEGGEERIKLRSLRRAIARHTARAWREIPHVTHQDVADITALEKLRRRHKDEIAARGGQLTLTALALKAAAGALAEHPRFNASLDTEAEEIVLKRYYHIGVALDSERGLIVPVIRDVDRKSPAELAIELAELSQRIRNGEARREDLQDGTFSITNVGSIGGTHFTPIINHPQAAILGLGRAQVQPVFGDGLSAGEVVPRLMLPLVLAFDHRIADGADAARFMNSVKRLLTDPEWLAIAT